jgi:hypothetical protein
LALLTNLWHEGGHGAPGPVLGPLPPFSSGTRRGVRVLVLTYMSLLTTKCVFTQFCVALNIVHFF